MSYHLSPHHRIVQPMLKYEICARSIIMKINTTVVVSGFMKRVIQVCCLIFYTMKQDPGRPVPKKDGLGDQNLELGDQLVAEYLC